MRKVCAILLGWTKAPGDPLQDVSVLSKVDRVMKNGEVVKSFSPDTGS